MAASSLKHQSEYLKLGYQDDPRLFHADASDQVQTWLTPYAEGYSQTIPLRDDLSLIILDQTVHETLIFKASESSRYFEFSFHLAGKTAGKRMFSPEYIREGITILPVQKRSFKVEVICKPPAFAHYGQAVFEHAPEPFQSLAYDWANFVHRYQLGCDAASYQTAFQQILTGTLPVPNPVSPLSQQLSASSFWSCRHLMQGMITAEMQAIVDQILSCPYGGRTRRRYLEGKALALIASQLYALEQQPRSLTYPLHLEDLSGIYEAGQILASQLQNPPSVEALARQVGLNRLKLNAGFHHLYGMTPFRFLRDCRLSLAQQLLMTPQIAVEAVAHHVGYASRSNFALAFRQKFGLNPKTFQFYGRSWSEQQRYAS